MTVESYIVRDDVSGRQFAEALVASKGPSSRRTSRCPTCARRPVGRGVFPSLVDRRAAALRAAVDGTLVAIEQAVRDLRLTAFGER
jgi:hypothetical protein